MSIVSKMIPPIVPPKIARLVGDESDPKMLMNYMRVSIISSVYVIHVGIE